MTMDEGGQTQVVCDGLRYFTHYLQKTIGIAGSELEELDNVQCECQAFLHAYEAFLDGGI